MYLHQILNAFTRSLVRRTRVVYDGVFTPYCHICDAYNIIKIKVHSSCEIEHFVETHLCKLCVIRAIARFTGCVCS